MKRKSILFKTFLFAAALITLVSAATLGALYFIMPGYYESSKRDAMQSSLDALARAVEQAADMPEARQLIAEYSSANNAQVWSYINDEELSTDLSFPFVIISGDVSFADSVRIEVFDSMDEFRASTIDYKAVPIDTLEADRSTTVMVDVLDSAPVGEGISGFSAMDTHNVLVADSSNAAITNTTSPALSLTAFNDSFLQASTVGSFRNYQVSSPIDSPLAQTLRATYTLQPISEAKGVILSLLPYVLLMSVIVAAAAAFFFSKLLTRPILSISGAAEQMRSLTPGAASPVCSDDELGALSGNLNALYSTLCTQIETLQAETARATALEQSKTFFLRAAGHELKTPIAALNGIVEGMIDDIGVYRDKDKYLRESKALLHTLAATVNDILHATRADGAEAGGTAQTDVVLSDMADDALDGLRVLMQTKNLCAENAVPKACTVRTCEHGLRTAVINILANAVQYAVEGSVITIRMKSDNDSTALVVTNHCAPIPAEHLPHLFEPFYSLSESRNRRESGTGLGLYLVKRNLDALGLPFALDNTDEGVAFRIVFRKSKSTCG